jgi:hypothetical protein
MKLFQFIILIMLSLFLGKVESLGFGKIDNFSKSKNSIGKSSSSTSPTQIQPFSSTESPVFFIDAETDNEDDDELSFDHFFIVDSISFSPLLHSSKSVHFEPFLQTTSTVKRFILFCSLKLDC